MYPFDFRSITFLLLLTTAPCLAHAQEAHAPPPYIAVTVEVNGLAESATMLDETMRQLSQTLSEIAASPEDLTPEQLEAFTALTRQTEALVVALDRALQGIGPAIRNAEQPSREVLAGWIETARTQAIDPTLASVDRSVRTWLVMTLLGVLLLAALASAGFILATRQLRVMATALRSIADDYEIVPKQDRVAEEPVAALPETEQQGEAPPERTG